jgi:hypothetical protein
VSDLSLELAEILRDAEERGSLIKGHPDLRPVSPEAQQPQIIPVRPFHAAAAKAQDCRTVKAPEPTGYSNPVDSPEFMARIGYKGRV